MSGLPNRTRITPAGICNDICLVVLCGLAAFAQWPIYRSSQFLIVAAVAVLSSLVISKLLSGSVWYFKALAAVGVFVLVGVPVAVPDALASFPKNLGDGFILLGTGIVTGWKQLLTLELPLGSYQGVLVPAFIVLLTCSLLIFELGKITRVHFPLTVLVLGASCVYAIVFGGKHNGWLVVVFGLTVFAAAMSWLLWRSARARRGNVGKVQVSGSASASVRRVSLGAAMAVISIAAAVALTPAIAGSTKTVARAVVDPELVTPEAPSPLSALRSFYTDDQYDRQLLRVDNSVSSLRLVTLPSYTGVGFEAENTKAAFSRIAGQIAVTGEPKTVQISVLNWPSGATEWVPLPGQVNKLGFDSVPQLALSKNFAYDRDTTSAVQQLVRNQRAGLQAGDKYSVTFTPVADVQNISASGSVPLIDGTSVDKAQSKALSDAIASWVSKLRTAKKATDTTSVAGVTRLIEQLYWSGQLSRSAYLADNGEAKWTKVLQDVEPEVSFAGENVQRMQGIFTALANSSHQCTSAKDTHCAVVYGDEEQFATAAALLARYSGFDSRVVMGWKSIQNGDVKSSDTTAWVEIGNKSQNQWRSLGDLKIPVDNRPHKQDDKQDYEKFAYDSESQNAKTVSPPEPKPGATNDSSSAAKTSHGIPEWVWPVLKVAGISVLALMILVAPLVAIVLAKRSRTRARRNATVPNLQIAGGWDEYVDLVTDYGVKLPRNGTRNQLAKSIGEPVSAELAAVADLAVFGNQQLHPATGEQYWQAIDNERNRLSGAVTRWQKLRATLNLKSFWTWLESNKSDSSKRSLSGLVSALLHGRNKNKSMLITDHKES